MCRLAMKNVTSTKFTVIDRLYNQRNSRKMWSIIRRSKQRDSCEDAITIDTSHGYYSEKFASVPANAYQRRARDEVKGHYDHLCSANNSEDFILSVQCVKRYVKRLKNGCAPGLDGITSEHLKAGENTMLPLFLCNLLTVCLRHGVVPDRFCEGLLVPIIKKATEDPKVPKSYRPVTISATVSKLLEYYILDQCVDHSYSKYQFGYIPNRGTDMATVLAHDVSAWCVSSGSPVYMCSLDAAGAFDAIPHSVLFRRAMGVIPDRCWQVLYYWYSNMYVYVKWNQRLSAKINVERGTRQGGLSSPLAFNLFYQDLIDELSVCDVGIKIGKESYNVYAYADDVLLSATTVTGLQVLIDKAVRNITKNGLSFNPEKTECLIVGGNPFTTVPKWNINGSQLDLVDGTKYLGTVLGDLNGREHSDRRFRASNRAFYSLQSAGLSKDGVSPKTAVHIYSTAVRPVLTFGCAAIEMTAGNLKRLDKLAAKHAKTMLGLSHSSRTTPLFQALNMDTVTHSVNVSSLDLLRSCITSTSATQNFYLHVLREKDRKLVSNTLVRRVRSFCEKEDIDLCRYLFYKDYYINVKKRLKSNIQDGQNGLVDSIRTLLSGKYSTEARNTLRFLLKAF